MSAIPFKLIDRRSETPTVATLHLANVSGETFAFKPGSFGLVQIEGLDLPPKAFSFSSSPDDSELELTIERVGPLTSALHKIPIGTRLLIGRPQGKLVLPDRIERDIVMIAGGTGIAPLRSMFRWLAARPSNHQIALFHSVRRSSDILYKDEFNRLANQAPSLSYQATVTRTAGDWAGPTGRLTPERLLSQLPNLTDRQIFLCGSPHFVNGFIRIFTGLGIGRDSISTEQWHQPDAA